MKKNKLNYGPAFNDAYFTQQINFAIPIIMKLGFTAIEAHIIDRLIRFANKNPKDVWASQNTIAHMEGWSKKSVARALSKAIKKKLIIVTREAKIPSVNSNVKMKPEDVCRHYSIVPLLLAMAKEEMEKEPEIEEEPEKERPKSKHKFGKASYNNPEDPDDIPDEATRGWKTCKDCHKYGPLGCSCTDKTLN